MGQAAFGLLAGDTVAVAIELRSIARLTAMQRSCAGCPGFGAVPERSARGFRRRCGATFGALVAGVPPVNERRELSAPAPALAPAPAPAPTASCDVDDDGAGVGVGVGSPEGVGSEEGIGVGVALRVGLGAGEATTIGPDS